MGEEWSYNPSIVSYWQKGKHNNDGYVSYLPSVMDFPLQKAMIGALQPETEGWSESFADLYRALANDFVYPDPSNLVVFADNHDMSRVFKQVQHDEDMWRIAMAYLAVTRGIPQIYYGTEILLADPDGDHGNIREDFPGGWEGDETNAFLIGPESGLDSNQIEAQLFLKELVNWRKDKDVIHTGELTHFAPLFNSRVYTLIRHNEEEAVVFVINKSDEEAVLNLEKYAEVVGNPSEAHDVMMGAPVKFSNNELRVPSHSFRILEVKR
ncbi:MAG: hypothetical protein HKN32_03700 [Flavobacteriales bacterium]|nr:hypothetical protein [Flavobacteriales bacterium]